MKTHFITLSSVAVIVVGTNEFRWLNNAFRSIMASDYKGRMEVIYVDNNSSDGSIDFIEEHFPKIRIITNVKNVGFTGANNKGLALAFKLGVKYVFFLNPDTKTPKTLISNLVKFMDENKEFGVIGPLQQIYDISFDDQDVGLNEWSRLALKNGSKHVFSMDLPDYDIFYDICTKDKEGEPRMNTLECPYVQGAALFIRAKILKKIEGFDLNYHTYYEEIDLCRKVKWLRYKVALLTNLYIQHKGGGSTAMSSYKKNLMMRNKYYFLLTDPTWKLSQMRLLFSRWLLNDIKAFFLKDFFSFLSNIIQLIVLLPTAFKIRRKNKRLTGNYCVRITKISPS